MQESNGGTRAQHGARGGERHEGDALDELIDALIAEHQTELLSAMQEEGHA